MTLPIAQFDMGKYYFYSKHLTVKNNYELW